MKGLVIFVVCFIMAFSAVKAEETEDENYAEWVKKLCDGKNRTFNEEMNACFQTEPEVAKDAIADCVNRAVPTAEGSQVEFLEVACTDKKAYTTFMECTDEYDQDEEYKRQAVVSDETVACYENVMKKYGLPASDAFSK